MLFGFENPHRPTRIKSLKELDPSFKPRWFKICFGAVLSCFPFAFLAVIGSELEMHWLMLLSMLGMIFAASTTFLVCFVPFVLAFVGYWWPWLGLKSVQLDSWLQRDLDWGGTK
ncbi:hypothetical protein FIU92_17160 [Ruegeria sp. THAF33]|nr:hypothetical protein FIU92_17160 [Ruegeria sp. THAF33]